MIHISYAFEFSLVNFFFHIDGTLFITWGITQYSHNLNFLHHLVSDKVFTMA